MRFQLFDSFLCEILVPNVILCLCFIYVHCRNKNVVLPENILSLDISSETRLKVWVDLFENLKIIDSQIYAEMTPY